MKRALAACKLLAWSSENVEKEACYYCMEGKLVELAVLLIVARKKVFVPITFDRNDGAGIYGVTILQCVKNQILSLVDEEMKLTAEFQHGKVIQIQDKIKVLRSTALLLEVFESAGDTIEEYLESQQPVDVPREQVEKDVALRLAEKGFILKDGDFDFSNRDCVNLSKSVGTPAKYLNHPSDKLSRFSAPRWLQQMHAHFAPRKEVPRNGLQSSIPSLAIPPLLKTVRKSMRTDQVSKFTSYSRYCTSVDIQKQSKPISWEILAKFALSVKRGIRIP
ncbi:uncharacterized protein LOC131303106 isoform X1 [Rhododendron vialii]|uniref:uncharacterized protein LOC131303106 isoform X1 n=1 Tax=Rhododendron vialii TaxID=182163 RepID=UPI00265FDBD0|nr:uncharacterized protein LOC131303106 isoform X1 [Rhododendron vialii]XP_058185888.1 uncharacterized protein LOC131303106 isoform X1 [Rhododendron vialii]